jgi:hypothetical protein
MKREKYYDFLFDWSNAEKGHEFEGKTKEYLAFLINDYSSTNNIPDRSYDPAFNNYKQGTVTVLKSAIDIINKFLDYNNSQKNYLAYFLIIQEKYHNMYLSLSKKDKNNEYVRGHLRASSDLYKGLTHLIQSIIEFERNNLSGALIKNA